MQTVTALKKNYSKNDMRAAVGQIFDGWTVQGLDGIQDYTPTLFKKSN
jgi:hypothetical protein